MHNAYGEGRGEECEGMGGAIKSMLRYSRLAGTVRHWRTVPLPAHLLLNRAGLGGFQTDTNIRGGKKRQTNTGRRHTHTQMRTGALLHKQA